MCVHAHARVHAHVRRLRDAGAARGIAPVNALFLLWVETEEEEEEKEEEDEQETIIQELWLRRSKKEKGRKLRNCGTRGEEREIIE